MESKKVFFPWLTCFRSCFGMTLTQRMRRVGEVFFLVQHECSEATSLEESALSIVYYIYIYALYIVIVYYKLHVYSTLYMLYTLFNLQ